MSNPEAVKQLYAKLDTIDVDVSLLANNAGIASQGQIADQKDVALFNMVNVNINAAVFVAKYFLPKFKARFES